MMKAITATPAMMMTAQDQPGRQRTLTAEFEGARDLPTRQFGHDARHDDQRNAVADAARGDLLAEPHQEDRPGRQGKCGREQEQSAGTMTRFGRLCSDEAMPKA